MNFRRLTFFILFGGTLVLSSCSGDSGGGSGGGGGTSNTSAAVAIASELSGTTWETDCLSTDVDPESESNFKYVKVSVTFDNLTETITGHAYATSFCLLKLATIVGVGTLDIGDRATLSDGEDVVKVDHTIQSATAIIYNFISKAFMNNYSICGYTDWEADVTKDLLGVDCTSNLGDLGIAGLEVLEDLPIFNQGDLIYDIIQTENGQMKIGDHLGDYRGLTDETRPIILWEDAILTKQ